MLKLSHLRLVFLVVGLSLYIGCASRDKNSASLVNTQAPASDCAGTSDGVELLLALPDKIALGKPLPVWLTLTNTGVEPVTYRYLNPYSDFEIRLYDAKNKPCALKPFGRQVLAQNMPGFTASTDLLSPVYIRSGSRLDGILEAANANPSAHTWSIDLNECYSLKSGNYSLHVIFVGGLIYLNRVDHAPPSSALTFEILEYAEDN